MIHYTQISNLGQVITGHTPPTEQRDYYGNDFRLIMPTDMVIGERYVPSTAEGVSNKWANLKAKMLIPANSTCVVTIGTIGKICLTSEPCFTNQAVNAVIPDKERFDPLYVFYLLKTIVPTVKHISSGTTSGRENVSRSSFSNIMVPVCPLPFQRKIASILTAYDDLIENNTRRIAILESMAQALYQEWFRDQSVGQHKVVTSDLIGQKILEIGDGYRAKNSEMADEGLPFLRAQNIDNGFSFNGVDLLGFPSVSKAGNKLSRPGDVVLTSKGTVGRFGFVTRHTPKFVYAPQLCYWRSFILPASES